MFQTAKDGPFQALHAAVQPEFVTRHVPDGADRGGSLMLRQSSLWCLGDHFSRDHRRRGGGALDRLAPHRARRHRRHPARGHGAGGGLVEPVRGLHRDPVRRPPRHRAARPQHAHLPATAARPRARDQGDRLLAARARRRDPGGIRSERAAPGTNWGSTTQRCSTWTVCGASSRSSDPRASQAASSGDAMAGSTDRPLPAPGRAGRSGRCARPRRACA